MKGKDYLIKITNNTNVAQFVQFHLGDVKPVYFENFDMESVVTPVNADKLQQLLLQSNYNLIETEFVVNGFREGFTLGYHGPTDVKIKAPNLKITPGVGSEVVLWNKVMKAVAKGRYAGPFKDIPFNSYIQSPIGLVPKDNGKDVRLIFHLSYPCGTGMSVNANTPTHLCTVKYPDFADAIRLCLDAGIGCNIGRSDVQAAFRNLGISKEFWKFLVMKAKSPFDGKTYYFFDKALPFGSSISCSHFQWVSNAIAHIVKYRTSKNLVNYLDDYLFASFMKFWCNSQIREFLKVCAEIGFPVSMEKTFWGTTVLVFLGLLIDTMKQVVMIPTEKINRAFELITSVLQKRSKKITLKQLQKSADSSILLENV